MQTSSAHSQGTLWAGLRSTSLANEATGATAPGLVADAAARAPRRARAADRGDLSSAALAAASAGADADGRPARRGLASHHTQQLKHGLIRS